jgi:hypothetical protein
LRRARNATRLKPHRAGVRGSGISPGTVDESETGSANFLCPQTRSCVHSLGRALKDGSLSAGRGGSRPAVVQRPHFAPIGTRGLIDAAPTSSGGCAGVLVGVGRAARAPGNVQPGSWSGPRPCALIFSDGKNSFRSPRDQGPCGSFWRAYEQYQFEHRGLTLGGEVRILDPPTPASETRRTRVRRCLSGRRAAMVGSGSTVRARERAFGFRPTQAVFTFSAWTTTDHCSTSAKRPPSSTVAVLRGSARRGGGSRAHARRGRGGRIGGRSWSGWRPCSGKGRTWRCQHGGRRSRRGGVGDRRSGARESMPAAKLCGLPVAVAEVVQVEVAAAPGGKSRLDLAAERSQSAQSILPRTLGSARLRVTASWSPRTVLPGIGSGGR